MFIACLSRVPDLRSPSASASGIWLIHPPPSTSKHSG
jgi:hypothetical protein